MKVGKKTTLTDEERAEVIAWVDSLAPWDLWFTGSFEFEASEAAAQRAFERFMKKRLPGLSWFYVTEPHVSWGFHVHALMAQQNGKEVNRRRVWKRWKDTYGRNRLEPIMMKPNVEAYCTKHLRNYLLKGEGWYNFEVNGDHYRRNSEPYLVSPKSSVGATESDPLSLRCGEGEAPAGEARTAVVGGAPLVGVRERSERAAGKLVSRSEPGSRGAGSAEQLIPEHHRGQPMLIAYSDLLTKENTQNDKKNPPR